ncbi:uncharacterized protein BJ171DRAFT_180519 [Polychytrium aggregatum]|uniref:uncharacterized protein n=1 Tax=Polychytrium aggregatum TaxID=110093 RepID=UPI0022FE75D3|nr:uncharacterized protein BJ171DRAFT_192021 [Polychytrium aggregatum]XP_052964535.1 uncharacterized protein BJ171DRAFT_180519 [Polychytrium aggregatum]KAI9202140.1 hypothetical protein BJ171DRAFT_192021 [Polychytrium aggregatum]KAI9202455.1 hypothetical protein BJ171DRAFT_180519 [Polychytrium aggregatum]
MISPMIKTKGKLRLLDPTALASPRAKPSARHVKSEAESSSSTHAADAPADAPAQGNARESVQIKSSRHPLEDLFIPPASSHGSQPGSASDESRISPPCSLKSPVSEQSRDLFPTAAGGDMSEHEPAKNTVSAAAIHEMHEYQVPVCLSRAHALVCHTASRLSVHYRFGSVSSLVSQYQALVLATMDFLLVSRTMTCQRSPMPAAGQNRHRVYPENPQTSAAAHSTIYQMLSEYEDAIRMSLGVLGEAVCSLSSPNSEDSGSTKEPLAGEFVPHSLGTIRIPRAKSAPGSAGALEQPDGIFGRSMSGFIDTLKRSYAGVVKLASLDHSSPAPEKRKGRLPYDIGSIRNKSSVRYPKRHSPLGHSNYDTIRCNNRGEFVELNEQFYNPLLDLAQNGDSGVPLDFAGVVSKLGSMKAVMQSNLEELRVVKNHLSAEGQVPPGVVMDIEILERCYDSCVKDFVSLNSTVRSSIQEIVTQTLAQTQQLEAQLTESSEKLLAKESEMSRMQFEILRTKQEVKDLKAKNAELKNLNKALSKRSRESVGPVSRVQSITLHEPNATSMTSLNEMPRRLSARKPLPSIVPDATELALTAAHERVQPKARASAPQDVRGSQLINVATTTPNRHSWNSNPFEVSLITTVQALWRGESARKLYRNHIFRMMKVQEIVKIERSFVSGLAKIEQQYIRPICQRMKEGRNIMSEEDFETIFDPINRIHDFNASLLSELEQRVSSWHVDQMIGDIFANKAPDMVIYSDFIVNYQKIKDMLSSMAQSDGGYKLFLLAMGQRLGKRFVNINDLLITPVQQLPRYKLLLQELLKATERHHPDFTNLEEAVSNLSDIVLYLNERKGVSDQLSHLEQCFVNDLPFELNVPGRHLVSQCQAAEIVVAETKDVLASARRARHLFIFSDILVSAEKSRFKASNQYLFKWALPLRDISGMTCSELDQGYELTIEWSDDNCCDERDRADAIRLYFNTQESIDSFFNSTMTLQHSLRASSLQLPVAMMGLILPSPVATSLESKKKVRELDQFAKSTVRVLADQMEKFQKQLNSETLARWNKS